MAQAAMSLGHQSKYARSLQVFAPRGAWLLVARVLCVVCSVALCVWVCLVCLGVFGLAVLRL